MKLLMHFQKKSKMVNSTKIKKRLPYIILFASMGIAIVAMRGKVWYVKKYGVFAIAKKIGISEGGKNGSASRYEYRFVNKSYQFSITDYGRGKEYIYTKLLPDKPAIQIVLPDLTVPDCLSNDSVLGQTWKQMPGCE